MPAASRPLAIFFDVNETLLDMAPLRQAVNEALGTDEAFARWFGLLLQYSLVATTTGQYHDFATLGGAALDMAATALQRPALSAAAKQATLAHLTQLPPHPDVLPGLTQLRAAGYRLFTLTNSPPATLHKQLSYSGLVDFFEQALSVDVVQRYKPHPATYHYATGQAGIEPAQGLLVAAHGWDVAGALAAGLQAAFVARPGQPLYPLAPPPQYQAPTINDLARQLLS